jgi:glycerol uptake facilitator-like aquaporin
LLGNGLPVFATDSLLVIIVEALGAAILVLGVSSVVWKKTPADASGLTIGTALTLGALAASVQSNGVVNPAVALGIGSFSVSYFVGPILGGVIGSPD